MFIDMDYGLDTGEQQTIDNAPNMSNVVVEHGRIEKTGNMGTKATTGSKGKYGGVYAALFYYLEDDFTPYRIYAVSSELNELLESKRPMKKLLKMRKEECEPVEYLTSLNSLKAIGLGGEPVFFSQPLIFENNFYVICGNRNGVRIKKIQRKYSIN